MSRIAVVSSCVPPRRGLPVTGGGLRTWQLVETLKSAGHSVSLMVERCALPEGVSAAMVHNSFERSELRDRLVSLKPSVVVVEQWALAAELVGLDRPIVIDLHGSLLLENVFRRGDIDVVMDSGAKIEAFAVADLLLVPSSAQLAWFGSWAMLGGFDPRELPLRLLPLALPGETPPARTKGKPPLRLVYGGAKWPWIDSRDALETAAATVEAIEGATLDAFLVEPPRHGLDFDEAHGTWAQVDASLSGRESGGIRLRGGVSHAKLTRFLRAEATVALDVWVPNPERMLAATTRTVEYLQAGLPVVTVEGASWAEALIRTGAGWTVPANDPAALRKLLNSLGRRPERIAKASRAASKLAATRHTCEAAGRELLEFCAEPRRTPRSPESVVTGIANVLRVHMQEAVDSLERAHKAEHAAILEGHRDNVAEIVADRGREIRELVAHWQAREDEALQRARDAELALTAARERVTRIKKENTDKTTELRVELDAARSKLKLGVAESPPKEAEEPKGRRPKLEALPLLPGRTGQALRLARLWVEHALDRDRDP